MAKRTASRSEASPLLSKFVALWLSEGKSRGLSPNSIRFYEQRMQHLLAGLETELGHPPTLAEFTTANFQAFILKKRTEGVYQDHPFHSPQERTASSAYIHGYFRTVRALGNFLEKQELVEISPMRKLQMPKLVEKKLNPLTEEEERRLLDAYSETTFNGCRTKALLMLMLDTGLRRAEVVSLKYDKVNLEQGFVIVVGKGNKERGIPFGNKTGWVLQRYATFYREPANPQADTFFLTIEGQPITATAVKMIIARAAKKVNIPRLHIHLLRHTYGIRTTEMGVPSLNLQHLMGHANVHTTARYAHAAQSQRLERDRTMSHLDQLPVKVKKSSSTSRRKP